MKNLTLFFATTLLSIGCFAQQLEFETTEISYGNIEKSADGIRYFTFKNTGAAPLIIIDAQKSCGCTVPSWPKEPIMPGESGKIQVKYDTERLGNFTKFVTVTSNSIENTTIQLKISGQVLATPAATPEKTKGLF
jgi:hypothetical protein